MKKNGTGRNVVQMLQSGPRDNGQTALAMVLTCLGCPVSPWELEAVDSAADLVRGARARGVYAEGCRMTARELRAAALPAIVHWRFRSFVVVSRVRGNRVWVNDPEEGLQILTMKEFEAGFTGVVVCFAGQDGAGQKVERPRAREFFARFPAAALLMGVAQAFYQRVLRGGGVLPAAVRRRRLRDGADALCGNGAPAGGGGVPGVTGTAVRAGAEKAGVAVLRGRAEEEKPAVFPAGPNAPGGLCL